MRARDWRLAATPAQTLVAPPYRWSPVPSPVRRPAAIRRSDRRCESHRRGSTGPRRRVGAARATSAIARTVSTAVSTRPRRRYDEQPARRPRRTVAAPSCRRIRPPRRSSLGPRARLARAADRHPAPASALDAHAARRSRGRRGRLLADPALRRRGGGDRAPPARTTSTAANVRRASPAQPPPPRLIVADRPLHGRRPCALARTAGSRFPRLSAPQRLAQFPVAHAGLASEQLAERVEPATHRPASPRLFQRGSSSTHQRSRPASAPARSGARPPRAAPPPGAAARRTRRPASPLPSLSTAGRSERRIGHLRRRSLRAREKSIRAIDGDAMQPRPQLRPTYIEPPQATQRRQECLLRDVLRRRGIARDQQGRTMQPVRMPAKKSSSMASSEPRWAARTSPASPTLRHPRSARASNPKLDPPPAIDYTLGLGRAIAWPGGDRYARLQRRPVRIRQPHRSRDEPRRPHTQLRTRPLNKVPPVLSSMESERCRRTPCRRERGPPPRPRRRDVSGRACLPGRAEGAAGGLQVRERGGAHAVEPLQTLKFLQSLTQRGSPARHGRRHQTIAAIGHYFASEVARLAGVSPRRIGSWARYGIIPPISKRPRVYSYADAGEAVLVPLPHRATFATRKIREIVENLRREYGTGRSRAPR